MMHLIKLSGEEGRDALHRTYEQRVATQADIRELMAHLQIEMQKANREGRELYVEFWTDYQESNVPTLAH